MTLLNLNFSDNNAVKNVMLHKVSFLLRQTSLSVGLLFAFSHSAIATTFNLPRGSDSLIDNFPGKPFYVKANREDSLIDIAVQYLLGQEEIVRANKGVDRWYPKEGTEVRIPTGYLLPDAPRQGVVINLPEYRLYYYLPAANYSPSASARKKSSKSKPETFPSIAMYQPEKVISYSVGIGRVDWKTPLGLTKVVGKVENPTWTPPPAIRAEHAANGDILPEVWPAGPDNPLGLFAFRLGIPGYLLHSTNKPQGVGMQVSHGCMRLYPKDIEEMFPIVPVGTQVNIINQPVKVGWSNGSLYIESHPSLEGEEISYQQRLSLALNLIERASGSRPITMNSDALKLALELSDGLPAVISSNDLTPPPQEPNIFDQDNTTVSPYPTVPPVKTYPPVPQNEPYPSPAPVESEGVVPRSVIEEELRQEEMQEREFKNSPFPIR